MRLTKLCVAFAAFAAAAACSPSTASPPGPAATCEAAGYTTPAANGQCAIGTCLEEDAGVQSGACCTAVCPNCESEGYVSFNEAGVCPPGTCESGDVTAALSCCGTSVCGEVDAAVDSGIADSARRDTGGDGATGHD